MMSDLIDRQAAIDALKNDMASLDHIIQGMSGYDVRLDAYVSQRNQVNCDIDTISNLPPAQPEPCEDDPRADVYYLAEKIGINQLYELVVQLRGEPEPCEDAVSRQAAIDWLNDAVHEHNITDFDAVATILALPPVTPKQRTGKWIPVTERLPEERRYDDSDYVEPSDSVLVYTKYNTYYISRYWGNRTTKGETSYVIPDWMDLDEYISDAVVAWMSLPKAYKNEGSDE